MRSSTKHAASDMVTPNQVTWCSSLGQSNRDLPTRMHPTVMNHFVACICRRTTCLPFLHIRPFCLPIFHLFHLCFAYTQPKSDVCLRQREEDHTWVIESTMRLSHSAAARLQLKEPRPLPRCGKDYSVAEPQNKHTFLRVHHFPSAYKRIELNEALFLSALDSI